MLHCFPHWLTQKVKVDPSFIAFDCCFLMSLRAPHGKDYIHTLYTYVYVSAHSPWSLRDLTSLR